jgi:DNA repair protein RadA/Sms
VKSDFGLEVIPIFKVIDAIITAIPSERSGDFSAMPDEDD